jgi:hypothetical protein
MVGLIVAKHSDPGRILELYYWSRDPGLYELIRAVLALGPASREAIQSFLTAAPDPRRISAANADGGVLTLAAQPVTANARRIRNAA